MAENRKSARAGETATARPPAEDVEPKLEIMGSRQFPDWLAEPRLSLAFTTNQAGKLLFVGPQPNGRLSIFERTFNRCMGNRCMGLCAAGGSLWMSSLFQLWRFENTLATLGESDFAASG